MELPPWLLKWLSSQEKGAVDKENTEEAKKDSTEEESDLERERKRREAEDAEEVERIHKLQEVVEAEAAERTRKLREKGKERSCQAEME